VHTLVGREYDGDDRLVDFGIVGWVKVDRSEAVGDRHDGVVIVSVVVQAAEPVLVRGARVR